MIKGTLTALAAISFLLLALAPPHSAQERQAGNRKPAGDRSSGTNQVVTVADAEKLRASLVTAYDETEALVKFLAGYDFLRQSIAMQDYQTACQKLEAERAQIGQISVDELIAQANRLPDLKAINQIIETSRSIRTDTKILQVFQKVERYSEAGVLPRGASAKKLPNSRDVKTAPAYIPPLCNMDDPSNYPSGADLAISNGIALALHAIADSLPGILGFFFTVPDPVRIAIVIAAYAVDEVTNALNAVASDAAYCEATRLYIEDNLVNDDGFTAILISNDFYLTFMLRTVRTALSKATNTGIPINCGNARLTEAAAYFDGADNFSGTGPQRVDAYSKLRTAYQNIGASACVQ